MINSLALSTAFFLHLLHLLPLIVVELQQHVYQFVGSLLHQRALCVELLGLFNAKILHTHVHLECCTALVQRLIWVFI